MYYNKGTLPMSNVKKKGKCVGYMGTLCNILSIFLEI